VKEEKEEIKEELKEEGKAEKSGENHYDTNEEGLNRDRTSERAK